MKQVIAFVLAVFAIVTSQAYAAGKAPFPHGPTPVAKKVNGKWVQVSSSNTLTNGKPRLALELIQYIQDGDIPLQVDIAQWAPPAPTTIAEAFWHLKNKTTASDIKWTDHDLHLLDGAPAFTVTDAIVGLAAKVDAHDASLTAYDAQDIEGWGIYHPTNTQDALDILVEEFRKLKADYAAYKAAHP